MYPKDLERLEQTLQASVSPYHCILESQTQLQAAGFEALELGESWTLEQGKSYYIPVFDSSLLAFTIGNKLEATPSLRMAAAHTDWPCLKVKPSPEVSTDCYGKLNIEIYGGPIYSTWMDRPLSMAGKVCVAGSDPFKPVTTFVDMKRPLVIVPNLAIHMNREVNDGVKLNAQVDMLPILTLLTEELDKDGYFLNLLAAEAGCEPEEILDYEIYLYNLDGFTTVGLKEEFYSGPRLDRKSVV